MRKLWSLTCLLLVGCLSNQGDGRAPSRATSPSDSLAAMLLWSAERESIDHAVGKLLRYDYVLARNVVVTDEDGEIVQRHSHLTEFTGPRDQRRAIVRDTASEGSGDASFWNQYARSPEVEDTLEWGRLLLEDEPIVLTAQGRGYYGYASLADTMIGSDRVRRIAARLLPGAGRTGIQSGQFYVAADSKDLVGFDLKFAQRSLLFDEESSFRYVLEKQPNGDWLPSEVKVRTFLNLPLTKGQHFQLRERFDHHPPGGDSFLDPESP